MKRSAFDIHTEKYDTWYDKNPAVYASELEAIRELMPSKITHNSIEIGVGTGRFASELGITYGLDLSARMLKIAESRKVECIKGVGESLPFKGSSMKLALMVTSLCFMDTEKALEEAYRMLAPEGYLIVAFVERNSLLGEEYRMKASESSFYKNIEFHTTEKVLSMLKDHGFEDMHIRQTLFKPLAKI
ncbi:class I SAM-dependent methyltransferase [Methanococcoides alaskense]|uniref:Ubiquinone/menaquinone biosynthesis C-methylase UbiE n=1 Tax=Methanococcoides alaskense TaxID=325778 RepID=A0AA90U0Q4_9EURY|nr:methyltransferase domain-containing protein [Methanococcoides alaskense]MDR6223502.1 ubiquinone/menaquinone biosynthesis C-methylase UbiE [Methanococcoides alaskense]